MHSSTSYMDCGWASLDAGKVLEANGKMFELKGMVRDKETRNEALVGKGVEGPKFQARRIFKGC